MKSPSKNYLNFLKINTSQFQGQWVVLFGKKIVGHGKTADSVYKKALKTYPKEKISLAKIPFGATLVLCLNLATKKK